MIELALKQFLPEGSNIKINHATKHDPVISGVTGTFQGPLKSTVLNNVLECVAITKCEYSIYRSGTGLTIKFE